MKENETSGVMLPPPVVYLVLLLAGYWADKYLPLPFLNTDISILVGISIIILSFILFGMVLREFSRLNTSVNHRKATKAIITTGAFRYSRNPIYICMAMLCVGVTFLINSLWGFVATLVASIIVTKFIISKEEAYLEKKFGQEYLQYCKSVRRWL